MTLLQVSDLTVIRRARVALEGVSFALGAGECVGLVGANGAGKTTLMRASLGLLAPSRGSSSIAALPPAARARKVAWLPQTREVAWPVSVRELVALGRIPHGRRASASDAAAIDAAIAAMGLNGFEERTATRLSGGEQARVLIARALAQDTPLLLADEPIAGLDPAQQMTTMSLFREFAGKGRTVLCALHDLGLAARYCSRVLVLHKGRLIADGRPETVFDAGILATAFGIRAHFEIGDNGPLFQPLEVL